MSDWKLGVQALMRQGGLLYRSRAEPLIPMNRYSLKSIVS